MNNHRDAADKVARSEENNAALLQLNELLKRSDYLNSIMQAHREATERIILSLVRALVPNDPRAITAAIQAFAEADQPTGQPSVDSEVRRMTRGLREKLQSPK